MDAIHPIHLELHNARARELRRRADHARLVTAVRADRPVSGGRLLGRLVQRGFAAGIRPLAPAGAGRRD